ncbi:MAG: elongation factor G, partial [Polyangiaceae bacterium]
MGEVVSSLRVADSAVFVLNAADPVQVGTEVAWGFAEKAHLPVVFVVNHCDRNGVEFDSVVETVQKRFGRAATVLQLPAGEGTRSLVDILSMKQLKFDDKGAYTASDIDPALKERADALRNELVENVAENDEELMEKYLEEGELGEDELMRGLRVAVRNRNIFPILVTSATNNIGLSRMLELAGGICPSPLEGRPMKTEGGGDYKTDPSGPPIAFVFKVMSEPHVGEYAFFRIASGQLENGMDLENAQTHTHERLGGVFCLRGRERDAVPKMTAGDIGATVKLRDTHTNNTLRPKGSEVVIRSIDFPEPRYRAAIHASTAGEEDKLSTGLHKLVNEDPSLKIFHDTDLGQLILGGQGEMHIDIAKFRLKHRFGVDVELSVPKVSYRETVQRSGRGQYRHKKQTGGSGQFADVSLIVEPLDGEYQPPPDIKVRETHTFKAPWGAEIEMVDAIVGGVIDMRRFSGAIQKGVLDAMSHGPIAGYPCANCRVIVYDGKMHSVDSNEAAFKTAARQCFKIAFEAASPVMLEPICDLEVLAPDDFTGDIMSDLNTRRARIQGMEAEGSTQKIVAQAPEVELLRYSTQLRSLTQGRGLHTARFLAYEPMPRNVQEQVASEAKRARTDGDD